MNQKSTILVVEGNIGAGKSTFLRLIKEYLNLEVIFEPHQRWQSIGGTQNLLELFYTDTPRWAYTFQSYAFITRIMEQEAHILLHPGAIHLSERSVFSDRYCFAKNAYENGFMTSLEWKLYQEWFSWLVDRSLVLPQGFIYLQTDPRVCYERIAKRARHEEATVALAYLNQLHDKHEQWLVHKQGITDSLKEMPVLVLQCNQEFEETTEVMQKYAADIAQFCTQQYGIPSLEVKNLSLSL